MLSACNLNKSFRDSGEAKHFNYRIIGIDSVKSYYLIYATKDKLKFIIVSKISQAKKKNSFKKCVWFRKQESLLT